MEAIGEENMAIVQFRVDDDVKAQASAIYEKLGMDLSTAIRIFLKRSIRVKGMPFGMMLDDSQPDPYQERTGIVDSLVGIVPGEDEWQSKIQ